MTPGDYAGFIWTAWGLSAAALAGAIYLSLRAYRDKSAVRARLTGETDGAPDADERQ